VLVWEICAGMSGSGCNGGSGVGALALDGSGAPSGAPVTLATPAAVQRRPYVAAGFQGAYVTYRDLAGAQVVSKVAGLTPAAMPTGASVTLGGGQTAEYPSVAFGGDRLAVVYRRGGDSPEIVLGLLDAGLGVTGEAVLRPSTSGNATNTAVAWNGNGWTAAWEDERNGDAQIFAAATSADGGRVDGAQPVQNDNGNWPSVASNGRYAVVAYYGFPRGAQILLSRVESNGRAVGEPLQVTTGSQRGRYGAVAYNPKDDEFAVVWQDETNADIALTRVRCP
jgi:hypothetical protein